MRIKYCKITKFNVVFNFKALKHKQSNSMRKLDGETAAVRREEKMQKSREFNGSSFTFFDNKKRKRGKWGKKQCWPNSQQSQVHPSNQRELGRR